jgi:hypothetical protein
MQTVPNPTIRDYWIVRFTRTMTTEGMMNRAVMAHSPATGHHSRRAAHGCAFSANSVAAFGQ